MNEFPIITFFCLNNIQHSIASFFSVVIIIVKWIDRKIEKETIRFEMISDDNDEENWNITSNYDYYMISELKWNIFFDYDDFKFE